MSAGVQTAEEALTLVRGLRVPFRMIRMDSDTLSSHQNYYLANLTVSLSSRPKGRKYWAQGVA